MKELALSAMLGDMKKFTAADALQLPVPERLQLVADICNTIADAPEGLELTDEDKRLIDERLATYHQNPNAGSPWKEVYKPARSFPANCQVGVG